MYIKVRVVVLFGDCTELPTDRFRVCDMAVCCWVMSRLWWLMSGRGYISHHSQLPLTGWHTVQTGGVVQGPGSLWFLGSSVDIGFVTNMEPMCANGTLDLVLSVSVKSMWMQSVPFVILWYRSALTNSPFAATIHPSVKPALVDFIANDYLTVRTASAVGIRTFETRPK